MEKKHILVVDDSVINLKIAGRVLKENELYNVVQVPSGERALKYLEQHKADLVLLDIMMPEMNGFEVLEQMQQNAAWKDVPVVFLTADEDAETKQRAELAGVKDIILKPFHKDELLATAAKYFA